MGSGASTTVKAIDIDSEKSSNKKERSHESHPSTTVKLQNVNTKPAGSEIGPEETSAKVQDLEKQLAESESQNLDLHERIQNLEERLSEQIQVVSKEEVCGETLHAKDQYISKLEQEIQVIQQENSKMKTRHKKKIKSLMSQLTEAKQGASIEMFEMKDEISRLREENDTLKNKVDQTTGEPGELATGITPNMSGHMSLILDLSQQVSEQQEKIRRLEENLKEKNKTIKKYKTPEPSCTDGSSVIKDEILVSTSWNEENQPGGNSQFMSSGWHSVNENPRPNKSKLQTRDLAPVEECVEDDTKFLSRSRDSGIGSAGKTKTTKDDVAELNVSKRIGSASSLLSGLACDDSDSDWGSDSTSLAPNKSQSAPPGFRSPHLLPPTGKGNSWQENKTQETSLSRSKKKKSVLRSKVDRNRDCQPNDGVGQRPELLGPTLAFVETA